MDVVTDKAKINEALTRAVEKIYPSREALEAALVSGRRLKMYLGIDPTSPHLHLGHAIAIFILKRFQELGHEIILLMGDFTAMIGDPTDKLSPRQPLSKEQVAENLKTFKKQAGKILAFRGENPVRMMFNSKWLAKMKLEEVVALAAHVTVPQLLERDMFHERLREGKTIGLNEFLYPLMQGYDSVAMDVDMEVGGNDQTFNMLVGRDLMKALKQKEKFVLAAKLLVDPETGKKVGKTENAPLVNLDDEPNEMFGKIMALGDGAIGPLAELCTELSMNEVEELKQLAATKPRDAKLKVAFAVVQTIYTRAAAARAKREFVKVFSEKQKPADIPTVSVGASEMQLADLLVVAQLAASKSEARRLIEQGGVSVNDVKKSDPHEVISLAQEALVQVGPRRFVRVRE